MSSPSPCPYFQTDGRQRGREGTRWRAGLRLGFCLETSTCLYCPQFPPAFHISLLPPCYWGRESRLSQESGTAHLLLLSLDPLCDPEPGPPYLWASTVTKCFSLYVLRWASLCTGRKVLRSLTFVKELVGPFPVHA